MTTKKDVKDLKTAYPKIAKFWDSALNELSPAEVTPVSKREAFWLCERGIHSSFKMSIAEYCNKKHFNIYDDLCPLCKKDRVDFIVKHIRLTPYEQSIYDDLKYIEEHYVKLDNKDYANAKRLIADDKLTTLKNPIHFGVRITNSIYNRISRDTYLDFSQPEDIFTRESYIFPFISRFQPSNYSYYASKCLEEGSDKFIYYLAEHIDSVNWVNKIRFSNSTEMQRSFRFHLKEFSISDKRMRKLLELKTAEERIKELSKFKFIKNQKNAIDFYCGNISQDKIDKLINDALLNFDLNMEHFKRTNVLEFENTLQNYVSTNNFIEIKDLKELKGKNGIYVLVLDEFHRVYIGQSYDIYKRIKQHWTPSSRKPVGRLIFGSVSSSIISIDCFGALDTTRIFYKEIADNINAEEYNLVAQMPSEYKLNRVCGGGLLYIMTEWGLLEDGHK